MTDGATAQALFDETFENYREFLNPALARVMKLSGSPVEVSASGVTIVDHTGKTYLDFAGGYGVFTLGHRHPRVVAAVRAQLDSIALSGRTMFNALQGRLAKRLAELTPGDLKISFFANSGAEAVEGALKLARAATQRTKIVATDGAFHGKTFGALSVSGRPAFREPFAPLLPDVVHVPFGDLDALAELLTGAAAAIVEPVQAEGGVVVPPAGYLRGVREICDRTGALFVADEVQTGLGRCGALFACDSAGVVPDIMTLAKGLSGGVVPIGAYVARADVWNAAYAKAPLLHTSTFGGNELACAAALAALDVLIDEDLAANARERGAELLAGAQAIARRYPDALVEARGAGLLVGVELRTEGYAGTIIPELLKRGVTAAWTLNQQRVIRLEPPLIVSSGQVALALAALDEAVRVAVERLGVLASVTGMPYVETAVVVAAPAAGVYELAKDLERFPEFMPDVESVTIVERFPDRVVSRWKTLIEDAPIEWLEEDRFDDAAVRIEYRLIEGDLDTFEGDWTFVETAGGTLVTLGVTYDFGVPTLAELIGPTLERKARENSEMMLAALKREAERAHATDSPQANPVSRV